MTERRIRSKRLHSFLHDPSAVVGSIMLLVFILGALFAPWITPQNPYDLTEIRLANSFEAPHLVRRR